MDNCIPFRWLGVAGILVACGSERTRPNLPLSTILPAQATTDSAQAAAPHENGKQQDFVAWLGARIPAGGKVTVTEGGAVVVTHTVAEGDTAQTIASGYLDVTSLYRAKDLAADIAKHAASLSPGSVIEIPHLLSAPYENPEEGRLRWPADRVLKGVFISGLYAGSFWPETVDKLAVHNMNAVVLDAKDYMGTVNYPTHVKLALETGAAKDAPIRDYARAIRFAHARGVHVIARIPCFHDPWAAKHAPRLSLMAADGRPFDMGWIDPTNLEAQDYILDLVREVIECGADEVQLDYVRFPVYSVGIQHAVMPPADGHRSQAIKAFVARVHEVTQQSRVPLSLDLFGVTATGAPSDIEALGQNIGVVGAEAEALSPMVYPSHYAPGYDGFEEPGNHPEIVGIGTRSAVEKLKHARNASTVMRPWLQASAYKASAFGPAYIQEEIRAAEAGGAAGWLMWDPDNSYWAVWRALPVVTGREVVAAK